MASSTLKLRIDTREAQQQIRQLQRQLRWATLSWPSFGAGLLIGIGLTMDIVGLLGL